MRIPPSLILCVASALCGTAGIASAQSKPAPAIGATLAVPRIAVDVVSRGIAPAPTPVAVPQAAALTPVAVKPVPDTTLVRSLEPPRIGIVPSLVATPAEQAVVKYDAVGPYARPIRKAGATAIAAADRKTVASADSNPAPGSGGEPASAETAGTTASAKAPPPTCR